MPIGLAQEFLSAENQVTNLIIHKKERANEIKISESLFSKLDVIEEKYISLKQKIDNLPQTILSKAFKGELVDQFTTDGDARELLKEIEALKATIIPEKRSKK